MLPSIGDSGVARLCREGPPRYAGSAHEARPTRRFPSAVSPTRPSPRRRRFGTSASSPTSITASRRWRIGCCNSPVSSPTRDMRAQYLDRMDIERERGITIKAQNVRLPWKVEGVGRSGLRAAPDRHPRPRRLHLRGVARAGGLRGRGAAGRRRPGHRGADAGQPVPGAGPRPARSSRCSTRSTCPPPTRTATPPRSRTSSAANRATCCGCRERPARASPICSTRWSARCRRRAVTPTLRRGR